MNDKKRKIQSNPDRIMILRRLGELISDGLLTLVKWNFLCLLTSLPIITIGPSLAALHYCTNALAKDDLAQFKSGQLYFAAFRSCFRKAFPVGILTLAVCGILGGGFCLYLSMIPDNVLYIPLTSLSALGFICFWGIMIHLLPMLFDFDKTDCESIHIFLSDQTIVQIFKESAVYAFCHTKSTLIVLVFSGIFLAGQIMIFPVTLPITVSIGLAFPAMAAGLAHTRPDV